jgi:hypothetical protein
MSSSSAGSPSCFEIAQCHLVVLADEAAKLPLRQFQLEQRKGRVGKRAGFDQTNDSCRRGSIPGLQAWTRSRDQVGHQSGRDRVGAMKLSLQLAQVLLVVRIECHGTRPARIAF